MKPKLLNKSKQINKRLVVSSFILNIQTILTSEGAYVMLLKVN